MPPGEGEGGKLCVSWVGSGLEGTWWGMCVGHGGTWWGM